MRIQHNIAAMNSYRNYTSNTKAVSKNLEKLSSGYKINRAGDDAAGLAISEKMRAQITGLKTASKNAKDGISLVQTAEGALTEVHSMLNRMVELTDQSANGTYDNEVDRANLKKEFTALSTEIDRIADSSNFNGIKLLDGSLASSGKASNFADVDLSALKDAVGGSTKNVDSVKGVYEMDKLFKAPATMADGDKLNFTMVVKDANGKEQNLNIELTAGMSDPNTGITNVLRSADGTEYAITPGAKGAPAKPDATEFGNAIKGELSKHAIIKDNFTITNTAGVLSFDARVGGTSVPTIGEAMSVSTTAKADGTVTADIHSMKATTKAKDSYQAINLAQAKIYSGAGADSLEKAIFEINGKKFAFIENGKLDDTTKAAMNAAGVQHYIEVATAGTIAAADITSMAEKIGFETGLKVTQGTSATANGVTTWTTENTGTEIALESNSSSSTLSGGLTLQIGETAESFNKLTVSVSDIHAKALGINTVDIGTQQGASDGLEKLKSAINSVSGTRGDLGAIQNRLDHTINNLNVMTENIQEAESSIRDVDVADEMMAYTKNNILVQSAQAMLAQANQLPQGVLQLLQ